MTPDFLNFRERERRGVVALLLAAALVFVILNGWTAISPYAESATVDVTATVASSVTCATDVSSTAFGTLSSGSVTTASPNASSTLSCNTGNGCTLTVKDVGNGTNPGLATTTPAYLIPSPDAAFNPTAVLAAGTEGYGITATTTAGGSGGSLAIYSRYNVDSGGNTVGGLKITDFGLASSSAAVSNRQLIIKHKAAISGTTQAANYVDTITYSCTAN